MRPLSMPTMALATLMALAACSMAPGRQTAEFTSTRIEVTRVGEGPDVLLIAGAASHAMHVWTDTMHRVPGYRYHVVQVNGFGGYPAQGNAGDGPVLSPVVAEVERYITEQRLRKPRIVGLSMGALIALDVAEDMPGQVGGVLTVDMIPFMGLFFGPPGNRNTPDSVRAMAERRLQHEIALEPKAWREMIRNISDTVVKTPTIRQDVYADAVGSDPSVLARALRDCTVLDLRPALGRIRSPVRALYVHSPMIPWTAAETDAVYRSSYANAPQATLARIPDSYHMIMLDQPERFAEELRRFLASSS